MPPCRFLQIVLQLIYGFLSVSESAVIPFYFYRVFVYCCYPFRPDSDVLLHLALFDLNSAALARIVFLTSTRSLRMDSVTCHVCHKGL